jgi:hypothetical protein
VDLNHIRINIKDEWLALFRSHSLKIESVKGWSILPALSGGLVMRAQQIVDRWFTKYPEYAFGLLFLLSK